MPDWFTDIYETALNLIGNDSSRPEVTEHGDYVDYAQQLSQLDSSKPIGVFVFTVEGESRGAKINVNVSRNNFETIA